MGYEPTTYVQVPGAKKSYICLFTLYRHIALKNKISNKTKCTYDNIYLFLNSLQHRKIYSHPNNFVYVLYYYKYFQYLID